MSPKFLYYWNYRLNILICISRSNILSGKTFRFEYYTHKFSRCRTYLPGFGVTEYSKSDGYCVKSMLANRIILGSYNFYVYCKISKFIHLCRHWKLTTGLTALTDSFLQALIWWLYFEPGWQMASRTDHFVSHICAFLYYLWSSG